MIEVKNLTKWYGDHIAIDRLNFTISPGKIYGFLGPNGAGKSTTMNIITGCLAASGGQVLINGNDIYKNPIEAKKNIGYLPELPPLYPDMTPDEYLLFIAQAKDIPKKERSSKINEVMDAVKIQNVRSRLIKNLSKGFRQRVGLAQAILGGPEIMIFDEPTVGLDPRQIIEIRDLIKKLGQKHTVILSSHILSEVAAVCDHLMIISEGRLVANDTPENLSNETLGNRTIRLLARIDDASLRQALLPISGIINIETSVQAHENLLEARIDINRDIDIREEIFFALSAINAPILGMSSSIMSLEDVFLELTDKRSNRERFLEITFNKPDNAGDDGENAAESAVKTIQKEDAE